MKTVTLRLPEALHANIEAEARSRRITKSAVMRERLHRTENEDQPDPLASIRDLIGSVDQGPPDLSARKKHYLRAWGFGRKHPPR